jgi:RNA polymerase sigma factor (sigma-70 family)
VANAPATRADVPEQPDDERRLAELIRAYAGVIAGAVRRAAGSRAAAVVDDVQQTVTVGLWRQLQRGQTIDRPASYLFRAAIRETLRLIRREQQHAATSSGVPVDPDATPGRAPGMRPDEAFAAREQARLLREALATLAPKRRQAVRAHLAGLGVQEIMELHGWPYQTARHLVARGMSDLRRALRDRGIDAS